MGTQSDEYQRTIPISRSEGLDPKRNAIVTLPFSSPFEDPARPLAALLYRG